jgi:hypothetical protein
MTQYTDYMMPFGWGEFEDEVKPIKKERQLHPISKLRVSMKFTSQWTTTTSAGLLHMHLYCEKEMRWM